MTSIRSRPSIQVSTDKKLNARNAKYSRLQRTAVMTGTGFKDNENNRMMNNNTSNNNKDDKSNSYAWTRVPASSSCS